MDPRALEEQLRQAQGAAAVEARLGALRAEFGDLLDRDALVLMAADEAGLLPRQTGLDTFGEPPPRERDVAGVLVRLSATRTFPRRDGVVGFVADADVRTPQGVARVVLWDDAVRAAQAWQGKEVRLTALQERERNGARELHSTRGTRVGAHEG